MRLSLRSVALTCLVCLVSACGSDGIPDEDAERLTAIFGEAMKKKDGFVRAEALRAIATTGEPSLAPLITPAYEDQDPLVKAEAIVQSAILLPTEARSDLAGLLRRTTHEEQAYIVPLLLRSAEPGETRRSLVRAAMSSDRAQTRRDALTYGVIPMLEDDIDRGDALSLLGNIKTHDDPELAGRALGLLADNGKKTAAQEEAETASRTKEHKARLMSLQRLSMAGIPDNAERLRIIAKESEGEIRGEAYLALVATGDSGALDHIRDHIGGGNKASTIRALSVLPGVRAGRSLQMLFPYRGDSRASVRAAVYLAMARHPKTAAKDFRRGVGDPDVEVVAAAIEGLARKVPDSLGEEVQRAFEDDSLDQPTVLKAFATAQHRVALKRDDEAVAAFTATVKAQKGHLLTLASGKDLPSAATAAFLVFDLDDRDATFESIENPSRTHRYAYLNAVARHLDSESAAKHAPVFRAALDDKAIAIRLIAAGGLWRTFTIVAEPEAKAE